MIASEMAELILNDSLSSLYFLLSCIRQICLIFSFLDLSLDFLISFVYFSSFRTLLCSW